MRICAGLFVVMGIAWFGLGCNGGQDPGTVPPGDGVEPGPGEMEPGFPDAEEPNGGAGYGLNIPGPGDAPGDAAETQGQGFADDPHEDGFQTAPDSVFGTSADEGEPTAIPAIPAASESESSDQGFPRR